MQQTLRKLTKSVKNSIESQDQIQSGKKSLESSLNSSHKIKTERKLHSARRRMGFLKKTPSLALPDLKVEAEAIQEVLFD